MTTSSSYLAVLAAKTSELNASEIPMSFTTYLGVNGSAVLSPYNCTHSDSKRSSVEYLLYTLIIQPSSHQSSACQFPSGP